MSIPLTQFESYIDPAILHRAKAYWQDDAVGKLKLKLLRKRNPEKVSAFLLKHIAFSDFREIILEQEFENGSYEKVIQISEEGILKDQQYAGLVDKWKKWKLKAYEVMEDRDSIVQEAKLLYLGRYDFEYYSLMKKLGGASRVKFMKASLLELYKNRRALKKELENLS